MQRPICSLVLEMKKRKSCQWEPWDSLPPSFIGKAYALAEKSPSPQKTKQKQIFSLIPMTFFLFLVARTSDMRSTLKKFLSVWSRIVKHRSSAVEQSPRSYSSCKTGLYLYLLNITLSCFEIYWYHSPLTFYRFWATCSLVIGCCVIHQVYLLWRKMKSIKGKNHSENGGMLKG